MQAWLSPKATSVICKHWLNKLAAPKGYPMATQIQNNIMLLAGFLCRFSPKCCLVAKVCWHCRVRMLLYSSEMYKSNRIMKPEIICFPVVILI